MGTTLTGTTPQDTYDSLIKVTDNGPISATGKFLSDGLGNDSALALSTSNVGIGTNNPLHKLDTRGILSVFNAALDGITAPTLYLGHPSFTTTYLNKISTSVSAAPNSQVMQFSVANGASTYADVMTLNGAGNVGIGTSSPDSKLSVAGSSDGVLGLGSPTTAGGSGEGAGISSFNNNFTAIQPLFIRGSEVIFRNSSAELFRITPNGVTFNGDTAAANALDDYEEGTWTPTLATDGTNFTSVTYDASNTTGKYTKIGNTVYFNGLVRTTAVTVGSASGNVVIGGLPFSAAVSSIRSAISLSEAGRYGDWTTSPSSAGVDTLNITLMKLASLGGSESALAVADVDTGSSKNFLQFAGFYQV
jgi:hypothetical protein